MMKMTKIWEIMTEFKSSCKNKGWKTSENEDWVEADGKYHNFLLAKEVPPSSFKRIALNGKCVIREGLAYRVVKPSYTAWLFLKAPSETLLKTVFENPDFSSKIAFYDMSRLLEGRNVCTKMNHTDSQVFQEFENVLKNELKIKLKPLSPALGLETNAEKLVTQIA
jgi:hypothetical protein